MPLAIKTGEGKQVMLNWRVSAAVIAAAMVGCASTPPLDWSSPAAEVVKANAGNYKAFVAVWMGALPRKNWANTFPLMPSDTRLIPLRGADGSKRQFDALNDTFRQWCTNSRGAAQMRSDDMLVPGDFIHVCETDGKTIAALWTYPDPDAKREGRLEILVQHWYPPDIDRYIQAKQQQLARSGVGKARSQAESAERQKRYVLEQEAAEAARKAQDQARLEELAVAARLRTTPPCQRFERESNALRVRFTAAVERAEMRRYLSDLVVAHDECAHAKSAPPLPLLDLYRFNLQSFQLFADAWDMDSERCEMSAICRAYGRQSFSLDRRDIARLQERYPAIRLSPPERADVILERVQRFVLDR